MTVREHSRFAIFTGVQHPYQHDLGDFFYTNPALGNEVSSLQGALDWLFAVLYPNTKPAVDTPGDLPAGGNTINDMRVVHDDGDGKAATYRWEQREGDVAAQWYKIYDMDWGYDSILSGTLDKTQDLYVKRAGYDDLDEDGVALTGTQAGQHIWGGLSANTHLNLHANAGDGTGAQTGFIQFFDNVRPSVDSSWSLGTTTDRWSEVWTDELTAGSMTISAGSIVDSTGAIDFDDDDLSTTGSIMAEDIFANSTAEVDTLVLASGSITDTTGAISFGNENLSTSGTVAAGTISLGSGSITDSSGAIDFGNEDLSTTGALDAGAITGTSLQVDNLNMNGNTLAVSALNGDLILAANGTGIVDVQNVMETLGQTVTGTMAITGILDADNIRLNGNTISTTDLNGSLNIIPNGTGTVQVGSNLLPDGNNLFSLGTTATRWTTLYLTTGIGDGTTTISSNTLQSLRDINVGIAAGMSLFWDGSKWVASAPDTEIDHGTVSGLGDDDHTQYALLAGRSGGQSLTGGTGAGDDLTLESTSNGTKGNILLASVLAPSVDDTLDLGTNSLRFADLWMTGEAHGLRLENFTTAGRPSASAGNIGRVLWDTDLDDIFVDIGGSWRQITSEQYYEEDPTNWDGVATTVTYDVSSTVNDSRRMIWGLKKNSADYEQVLAEIDFPTATSVRVTVGIPLASGTYTLVGR
jgi:hypothetical protein